MNPDEFLAYLREPEVVDTLARFAHEANRSYCLLTGDTSQTSWDDAPDWQKSSARNGVLGVFDGNGPEQSHESWLAEKEGAGWKYGPVKNPDLKEHPCFVPYAELPAEQQIKDYVFIDAVKLMVNALAVLKAVPLA
jgi:RyR domain